jgi:hypothetical protein
MIEGLILVRTQLLQTLQEEGLERVPVMGIAYDPEVAEAVGTQPVDDPDHHHVVMKDIRRGYRLNGKLARAAQVIVGEYSGELPAEPEAEAAAFEDSGRVDVVETAAESTGAIAALAAEAAAAIESGEDSEPGFGTGDDEADDESMLGEVDLEAAAREAAAMAEGDEGEAEAGSGDEDLTDDVDLEAAAREAAAVAAEGEEAEAEAPEQELEESGNGDALISDEGSLEQAAREAAALVEEDEAAAEADSEPAAPVAETPGERKPRARPVHPLDDVDPSVFEEPESEASSEPEPES